MEKTLKAAVIGCGNISVMHLDSIVNSKYAHLVAVCDIKKERAEACAKKYGVRAYTDMIKLFEEEKPDAVHICLPHYLHVPAACEAFRRGINVLCEKPMSINFDDAEKAVECAEQNGVLYGVIFQSRYNLPSVFVKERIEDGRLGKVKCGRVVLTWSREKAYYDASDWKGTPDKEGGGVIIDQAIHSLDLANWFIGSEPESVQSSLHNRAHPYIKVEDSGEGLIFYKNGARLAFYAMNCYFTDDAIEIRLLCENGRAVLSYEKAVAEYADGSIETADGKSPDGVAYSGGKSYWGTSHARQIEQFYKAILKIEPLEISGREALKTQKLICGIYKNSDTKI